MFPEAQSFTRVQSGAASELKVASDLIARGYNVFRALTYNSGCDLIAMDKEGKVYRIEVRKISRSKSETGLQSSDFARADWLATVYDDGDIIYRSLSDLEKTFQGRRDR